MEPTVHRFVLRFSLTQTLILIGLTLASLPLQYVALDIPKTIVNQAITGRNITYPTEVNFGLFTLTMDQVGYLFLLCFFYLVMVLINGGLKQYINSYKGRLGERLLRRLRYELLSRMLRFPMPHFRKVSAGELIPMVTSEVETLGGYMGDAFAQPLIQAGTLLTIAFFLFMQNPIMGFAAMALYPIQGYIIPKLQKRVNQLGKERVRTVRKLSERIGETVGAIQEVHANGTVNYERTDYSERLGLIYRIRMLIYLRKSLVKFLNNLLNQMAPLLFYSIGGYLVIHGELSLGALTAALAAQKDMTAPWKELLDYYQQTQDAKIKYDQVTEQFRLPNLTEEPKQVPLEGPPQPLAGPLGVSMLAYAEDVHSKVLENVSFEVPPASRVALIGPAGGGKDAVLQIIAGLIPPSAGKVTIGSEDLAQVPESRLGARIGYVGQSPLLFAGSVRDNLIYGLKQRPVAPAAYADEARRKLRASLRAESARAGNLDLDIEADWVDLATAGVADRAALNARLVEVLERVDVGEDLYQFGLRGTIDSKARPEIAAAILKARASLRARLEDPELAALIEPFDPARYNAHATLAENLLFGTPVGAAFDAERLAESAYVLAVLDKVGLTEDLLAMGREVAETMIELFADLPPGHEFFEQFSFIRSEDLPEFQALLARTTGLDARAMKPEDRARLLSLPFKLIVARHRLGLLDEGVQARVLEARRAFREGLPEAMAGAIEFFDPAAYNASATLQDNILFGKIAYGQANAAARIGRAIHELLDALGLRQTVLEVGLDHPVGVGGSRLNAGQRQKLVFARALVKRPDLLLVNEATAILDAAAQARVIEGVFADAEGRSIIWVTSMPALARRFDRVLMIADGRVAADGPGEDLDRADSPLAAAAAD